MPVIPKKKQQTIHLAIWDHKHGQDVSAHTTEDGAQNQCIEWAREAIDEWATKEEQDYYTNMNDSDLLGDWGEISGYTEFFEVRAVLLHEDMPNEKKEWAADTSHIGA